MTTSNSILAKRGVLVPANQNGPMQAKNGPNGNWGRFEFWGWNASFHFAVEWFYAPESIKIHLSWDISVQIALSRLVTDLSQPKVDRGLECRTNKTSGRVERQPFSPERWRRQMLISVRRSSLWSTQSWVVLFLRRHRMIKFTLLTHCLTFE